MNNVFKGTIGVAITLIISMYTLIFRINYSRDIIQIIVDILPVVLIVIAAILAQIRNKSIVAGVALLFAVYSNVGSAFVSAVLNNSSSIGVTMILDFIIFLFLIVYIFVNASNFKATALKSDKGLVTSMAIAFLYFYFRDGFGNALVTVLPALIAFIAGSGLAALLLLLAGVINVPIFVLSYFFDGINAVAGWNQKILPLVVYGGVGLYLLITGLLALPKYLKE